MQDYLAANPDSPLNAATVPQLQKLLAVPVVADGADDRGAGPHPRGRDRLIHSLAAQVFGESGAVQGLAGQRPPFRAGDQILHERPEHTDVVPGHSASPAPSSLRPSAPDGW